MARILFISDTFINESLGIMYLSSYLKKHSHDVRLTLLWEYKKIDDLLKFIKKTSPDLVGFSVMTPQVNIFRPIAKIIKEATGHLVVWGGAHCMFMPEEVVDSGYVDIICRGEGEESLLTLMNRIDARQETDDIPNLWIKKKDRWIKNDLGKLESDLDKYPFPDRGLYYDKYPLLRNFALKRFMTQRGCPHDCSYCFEPTFKKMYEGKGKLVRRHSVEYVINEVKSVISKYPTRAIHFSDDTFNLNENWVMEFLRQYKQHIDLSFTCNISVLGINEEMIRGLKDSGCKGVTFGLEHGVENIRMNILNKRVPNKNYIEITKLLNKYNLKFLTNVMLCLPCERMEDAIESIRFARVLKPYGIRVGILKIYKGTKLAEFLRERNLLEAAGKFTYKSKDVYNEYKNIKKLIWTAQLFIHYPLFLRFSKRILSSSFSYLFKPVMLLSYWRDASFFSIPFFQALMYFWHAPKMFIKGIGDEQPDVYKKIKDS
ncbi:MAG: radical SAM protein [Candidatus Omnitrophota bacterium]|nr:radical SAM protein [Candidatus Omnitrophota bacterium]